MAKPGADEFYLDAISRVTVDQYARGRMTLVGDAARATHLAG